MWTFGQETAILSSSPPPHAEEQEKKKIKNQAATKHIENDFLQSSFGELSPFSSQHKAQTLAIVPLEAHKYFIR